MRADFISKKFMVVFDDSYIKGKIIRRGNDFFVKYNKKENKCEVLKNYPNGYSILKYNDRYLECYENENDKLNGAAGVLNDVLLFGNDKAWLKINVGLSANLQMNYIYYEVNADGSQQEIYDNRTIIEAEWRFEEKLKEQKVEAEKGNN